MTTIDVHAHFLPDFYRDALFVAGLREPDGIAQLPPSDAERRREHGKSDDSSQSGYNRWTGYVSEKSSSNGLQD